MSSTQNVILSPKVAIYIRVSTQWQIDKDSLQVQRRELIAYSQIILGINDYEVFEDPGYSAKNTDRPAYQKMMSLLRTGEFSHLLVWKIDRISRNLMDFTSMYTELKSLGITFVSKNEQFDTSSAIGEAMLKIILVFAELERNMTAERVSAVMLSRANNGQWNGGRIPYGYTYNKETKEFSINKQEADNYLEIVSLYEEHQSVLYVSRKMTDRGIRTRNGNVWSTTAIHKLLTNIFYTGAYRYNVHNDGKGTAKNDASEWITVNDHHPALIDELRYNRIQFILKRNSKLVKAPYETRIRKNIHVFSGLIKCGQCGSAFTAALDRRRADGWRPSIYGCSTRRRSATKCSNKYVNDSVIGPVVFGFIGNILVTKQEIESVKSIQDFERLLLKGEALSGIKAIDSEGLQLLYEAALSNSPLIEYRPHISEHPPKESEPDLSSLKARRTRSENALSRLKGLYLYGDNGISEKDYIIERQKIVDEINQIDNQISVISNDVAPVYEDSDFLQKSSYLLLVNELVNPNGFDYEKFIRSCSPEIPREFITSILSGITILDSHVTEISFRNGISIHFSY